MLNAALSSVVMQSVVMHGVFMLNVAGLNVVAPLCQNDDMTLQIKNFRLKMVKMSSPLK
jgi:hypothetical protein